MASNVRFVDSLKVGAYNTGQSSGGGGGAKEAGTDGTDSPETGGAGGEGLLYNVADGSTPVRS